MVPRNRGCAISWRRAGAATFVIAPPVPMITRANISYVLTVTVEEALTSHELPPGLRERVEDPADNNENRADVDDPLPPECGAEKVGNKGDQEGREEDASCDDTEIRSGRLVKVSMDQQNSYTDSRLPCWNSLESGKERLIIWHVSFVLVE